MKYAKQIEQKLKDAGLRIDSDYNSETIDYKIRQAEVQKIPYMMVVGDAEIEQGAAAVRLREGTNLGPLPMAEVVQLMKDDL